MTPEQIARPNTEASHQTAFFAWIAKDGILLEPRLVMTFAIPNGEQRSRITGARLKAQGVKPGVPDVYVPIPVGNKHGLWLEFKRPGRTTLLSAMQREYQIYLVDQGYSHAVPTSYTEAIDYTLNYLCPEEKK